MKKIVIFTTALFLISHGYSYNTTSIKSFFIKSVKSDETTARVVINEADKHVKFKTKSVFNEATASRLLRIVTDLGHYYVDKVSFDGDECSIQFNTMPAEDKLFEVIQLCVSHLNFVDFVVVSE